MFFDNRNNNSNQQRPTGKEDAPNKVKFSSVKLGETKQGSPTVGLYLKRDQMERMVELMASMLEAGEDGCKLSCIVIHGKDYDSGYTYVNPKEERKQGQGGSSGGYNRQNQGGNSFKDKGAAKSFFQSKRVDDGEKN